jgi:hypothetical protein
MTARAVDAERLIRQSLAHHRDQVARIQRALEALRG